MDVQDSTILNKFPPMKDRLLANGRLRIKRVIGCGAWAACFEAESTSDDGEVYAVKAIPRKDLNEKHRARIEREVELHKKVSPKPDSHENILRFVETDVDEEHDIVYIVSEYCAGGDLHTSIARDNFRDNCARIRDTFIQILDGTQAMHDAGIFHRDLKPRNIFLRACGTPVLGDFGLATELEACEKLGIGTMPYMSAGAGSSSFVSFPSLTSLSFSQSSPAALIVGACLIRPERAISGL